MSQRLHVGARFQDQHEAVAADAIDHRARQTLRQALRYGLQQCIAAIRAETGIDGFEAIEVKDRDHHIAKARPRRIQIFRQGRARAHACERVAARRRRNVGGLARGDVGDEAEATFGIVPLPSHRRAQFVPAEAPARSFRAKLKTERYPRLPAIGCDGAFIGSAVVGMNTLQQRIGVQFGDAIR